jgi:hypothetical protein
MDTKTCTKCKNEKPIVDFQFTWSRGKRIQRAKCRDCMAKCSREYCRKRSEKDPAFRQQRIDNATRWTAENPAKRAIIAKARNKRETVLYPEKVIARALINQRVRFGRMPKASSLICKCGNPAHHYHHHLGYAHEHRYNVVAICRTCHKAEHSR